MATDSLVGCGSVFLSAETWGEQVQAEYPSSKTPGPEASEFRNLRIWEYLQRHHEMSWEQDQSSTIKPVSISSPSHTHSLGVVLYIALFLITLPMKQSVSALSYQICQPSKYFRF